MKFANIPGDMGVSRDGGEGGPAGAMVTPPNPGKKKIYCNYFFVVLFFFQLILFFFFLTLKRACRKGTNLRELFLYLKYYFFHLLECKIIN
jgi:hypothetical protein